MFFPGGRASYHERSRSHMTKKQKKMLVRIISGSAVSVIMRIYTMAHASLACSLSRCDKKIFSQGTARHSVRFSGVKPAFWVSCTAVDVTKSAERDWQLLAGCVIIYFAYSSCSRSYKTHSETCVISEKGKTFFKKRTCYRGQYKSVQEKIPVADALAYVKDLKAKLFAEIESKVEAY